MFQLNKPSSGVQVVVMDPTAHITKAEQHYSDQQNPSLQQPVHLMMAS
jgi:hypothetical protein